MTTRVPNEYIPISERTRLSIVSLHMDVYIQKEFQNSKSECLDILDSLLALTYKLFSVIENKKV